MKYVRSIGSEDLYICPFCPQYDPDTSGHLHLNKIKGVYHCFRCNASGNINELSSNTLQFIDPVPDLDLVIESIKALFAHNTLQLPFDYTLVKDGTEASQYLVSRGIDLEMVEYYNIGYTKEDNYSRVYFPDYDREGNLCFYCSRLYKNIPGLRWKFPSSKKDGVYKGNQLYDFVRANEYSQLIVVEGITSKLVTGKNATATYGTGWTNTQLFRLADSKAKEIIIMYDGDNGYDEERKKVCELNGIKYTPPKKGREKGEELSIELSKLRKGIKLAEIPMGKDPGDYYNDRNSLQKYIDSAIPIKSPVFLT